MVPKANRTKTEMVLLCLIVLLVPSQFAAAASASNPGDRTGLLIQQLKDEHWQVRRDAALALGAVPPEEKATIKALAGALRDPDSRVRRAVAEALGKAGPKGKAAVPYLVAALDDPDALTRQAAVKALGGIGAKGKVPVSPLAAKLEDNDPGVREAAALALGGFRGKRQAAIPALRKALGDRDERVRSAVAVALGEIGLAESVSDLIEKLKDESPEVRQSAAQALGKIGKPAVPGLLSALHSADPGFLEWVVEALRFVGQPAAEDLIHVLKDRDQNSQVRQYAAMALATLARGSSIVVQALIEAVSDPDVLVRRSATEALAKVGPEAGDAIGPLIKRLKDQSEDSIVRQHAARALAQIGPGRPEVAGALTEALDDNDPNVQVAVVKALAATSISTKPDESSTKSLRELSAQLSSGEVATRRTAAAALASLGPGAQAALPALINALGRNGEDAEVLRLAAEAVGSMGSSARAAVPVLKALMENESEPAEVRASSIAALGQIGPDAKEAIPALIQVVRQGNPQLRPLALIALERAGPAPRSPIPAFREALAGGSLEGRGPAALSLQDFVITRAQQWQPLLSQAQAPVLRSWAARLKDLYGVEGSEFLPPQKNAEDKTVDVFNVLGGRAAVQESLQLQLIGAGAQPDAVRTIPVASISGVKTRSHPFAEMLSASNQEGGRLALADLAPPDHFFAYFAGLPGLTDFLGGGLDFLSRLDSVATTGNIDYEMRARYLGALGLSDQQLAALDQTRSVKEIAVVSPDLFFVDGTELVVIVQVDGKEKQEQVQKLLDFAPPGDAEIVARELGKGRKAYWAASEGLIFFSTNRHELEKVLTLGQRGGRDGLGQSAEFRYMLGQLPVRAETRAFFYFSDPFLRNLVGPETKIGQWRRLQARAELEMVSAGALLYKLDGNTGAPALNKLAELGYVPKTFLRRDFSVHEDFVAESKIFGTPAQLKSLLATPVDHVSDAEAKAYGAYVDNYSRFWSQYFDPIAMRLDSTDGHNFELTTFILPLLDSELYNQLRKVVVPGKEQTALKVPALSPAPVLMLSLNVNDATRLQLTGQLAEALVRYTSVDPKILDSFGSGVHFAVLDSEPIVALGSGDVLGALGGQTMMGPNLKEDQLIPILLSVLTRPCKLLIELQDPDAVLAFLRQASLHRSLSGGEGELYQVKDKDAWIYKLNIEKIMELYLGVTVENGYLVISNLPWSQPGTVTGASESALNGALLQLNLSEVHRQLPALHTKVYGDYRRDTIEGMGDLYPLLASGYAGSVEDALGKHYTLFGFKPVHPGGGSWLWENGQVKSSMFGTAERPMQPEFLNASPDFGLFQNVEKVSVNMRFEDAGLRTQIRWALKAEAQTGP